ncbi:hypothetical protein MTO96_047836 [Rhipicephalus appendiculatus]
MCWRGSWDGGRMQGARRKRRAAGGGRSPGHAVRMPAPYAVFNPRANNAGSGVGRGRQGPVACSRPVTIQDVWASNLEEAFQTIRHMVQQYNYVAMDTEFPGVVARPIGEFRNAADYQYQLLRCNVDLLKIIQLGLTFLDEAGNTAPDCCTWQFNFKFNLNEDMYAQDSIDLLVSSGIQFGKHSEEGIDPYEFAQLFMTSGVVFSENVRWLTFHSGYDFGYLLKSLRGGLQEVADQLHVERVGQQHQAGSDSLLTAAAFFKMRQVFFNDQIDDAKYCGQLYGLGPAFSSTSGFCTTESDPLPAPTGTKFLS